MKSTYSLVQNNKKKKNPKKKNERKKRKTRKQAIIEKKVKLTILCSTWSGTLRELLHMACAEECENITGAFEEPKASNIVGTETCDKSTIMPKRFISCTTSFSIFTKHTAVVVPYIRQPTRIQVSTN